MKTYVCGFLFMRPIDDEETKVVLIRKNRPEWQAGRLNGVGGKFEEDLDPSLSAAMVREFHEETGAIVRDEEWTLFCVYSGGEGDDMYRVYFFKATPEFFPEVTSKTDEKVEIVSAKNIPQDTIYNLHWLIPLALDESMTYKKPVLVREQRANNRREVVTIMGRWKLLKSKRDISLFMRAVRYMIVLVLVFPWSLVFGAAILSKCL